MNKFVLMLVIYSVFIIAGILLFINLNDENEIKIAQGKSNLTKLEIILEEANDSTSLYETYNVNQEMVKVFQDIEKTLSFFVTVLKEEKVKLFTSFFIPEDYSKDLWRYSDDPYFNNANYKIVRELNRNGTLVSAKYDKNIKDGYKSTRQNSNIELILIYEDGKEVELELNFILRGTKHSNEDNIYFIENSVLDLINSVQEQTQ